MTFPCDNPATAAEWAGIPVGADFRSVDPDGFSEWYTKTTDSEAKDRDGRTFVFKRFPGSDDRSWDEAWEAMTLRFGHRSWVAKGSPVPSVEELADPAWRRVEPRDGWGLERVLWLEEHPELVRPSDCIHWHARKSDTAAPLEVGISSESAHV